MTIAHIKDEIEVLKQTIYSELHHRILLNNTGVPIVKEEQLFFMLLPFLQGERLSDEMLKNIAAVGIVHASLEEHEKVKEISAEDKEQQLTVLSGDYYSGRYYEILAKTGNIALIHHLSTGIVARCEQQIKLYETEMLTIEDWVQYFAIIESELISQFYEHIQQSQLLSEIAKQSLTVLRLQAVAKALTVGEDSILYTHMRQTGMTSKLLLEQIEVIKQNVHNLLSESPLKQELKNWIEDHCLA